MNYTEIYKKVLNYHRVYTDMKGSDEDWEKCVRDGDCIAKSFDNAQFAIDLIIAVQREIARKIEGGKTK